MELRTLDTDQICLLRVNKMMLPALLLVSRDDCSIILCQDRIIKASTTGEDAKLEGLERDVYEAIPGTTIDLWSL